MRPLLSVNIDHVATLRQARYRGTPASAPTHEWGEPDVARSFHEVELAGAHGITVHLREDRRHVTDRDVELLARLVRVEFNLEMAATDEMVGVASRVRPHSAMLVPEGRNEVTTEGGLDVRGQRSSLRGVTRRLKDAGCRVSAFIDADLEQVRAAHDAGFDVCEIHTGPYAVCFSRAGGALSGSTPASALANELERVERAMREVASLGMACNAGHALNHANVGLIAGLLASLPLRTPPVLHIGHAIISRAVFVGLRESTRGMLREIEVAAHNQENSA